MLVKFLPPSRFVWARKFVVVVAVAGVVIGIVVGIVMRAGGKVCHPSLAIKKNSV